MLNMLSSFTCRITFCLALLASPLLARTVRGVVTDSTGKPVAAAAVRLKNMASLRIRSARSSADGAYSFHGLDPRIDYELRATHKGRSSGRVILSRFDEGDERTVDLQLK